MIEMKDFVIEVRRKDGRTRLRVEYLNKHLLWIEEEVRDLQAGMYPVTEFEVTFREGRV